MMKWLLLTLVFLAEFSWSADCVILLHGLARSDKSMTKIEKALIKEKYTVVNSAYNSREGSVEDIATSAIDEAIESCDEVDKIHFVSHSMGGILIRQYFSENNVPNLGRTVMLGPPNQGSEVVDKLGNYPGFSFLNGEAGLQLGNP